MLESVLQQKATEYAVSRGWFSRKVQWMGRRGAPDKLFARGGLVVFVEFKQKGKKPNLLQEREIARMQAAGLWVLVFDDLDTAHAFFT
jgi:hypothetical protein